jgi:hypothetical protein
MKIKLPDTDLRRDTSGSTSIDDGHGNLVGQLLFHQNSGRTVVLFGKYRGDYEAQAECQAFADGVVAVLSHMTAMDPKGVIR